MNWTIGLPTPTMIGYKIMPVSKNGFLTTSEGDPLFFCLHAANFPNLK